MERKEFKINGLIYTASPIVTALYVFDFKNKKKTSHGSSKKETSHVTLLKWISGTVHIALRLSEVVTKNRKHTYFTIIHVHLQENHVLVLRLCSLFLKEEIDEH